MLLFIDYIKAKKISLLKKKKILNIIFSYISRLLPDLSSTYEALLMNRRCWAILEQVLKEEDIPSGGLAYLKDIELETKVLQRVESQNDNDETITTK